MKLNLIALTLALNIIPLHSYAQKPDAGDEYDFLKEVPTGLFDCYDTVNDFGHFTGMLSDKDYHGLPTISVDNQSMPVTQKIIIKSVQHGKFNSDYVIHANISTDSECLYFKGRGLTEPTPEKCDPEFFAVSGTFEIHLQPIMSIKGPVAELEEDQGQTLATYRYSEGSPDWNSKGMMKCSFNAANLRKLMK